MQSHEDSAMRCGTCCLQSQGCWQESHQHRVERERRERKRHGWRHGIIALEDREHEQLDSAGGEAHGQVVVRPR